MEASSTPDKSLERLLNEGKRYADKAKCRQTSGFEADCVEGDPYHWHVKIYDFFGDSTVAKDLAHLKEQQGVDHVLVSFRFTTEYPLKPPTVRVLYPRFAPRSTGGVVSTGGTVQLALFTYQEWSPINTMSSIVTHLKNKLVEANARIYVTNPLPYTDEEVASATTGFYTTYVCNTPAFIGRPELNYGGKILLPASALQEIVSKDVAGKQFLSDSPLVFELSNPANGKKTYAGVMEFLAEEGHANAPFWLMQHLELTEGDDVNVRLVTLPKGTFVKFKAHDSHFFVRYPDPKPIFETVLRNFAALSQGDHIDITFDAITYHFEVLETQPHTAIDINNVDIEVEFQRTLTEEEQLREIARIKREREAAETDGADGEGVKDKGKEKEQLGRRLDEETEDAAPQADTTLCKNCQRRVPTAAFTMHSAFCERNNVCCMKCGRAVKVSEKEKHDQEFHAQVECGECGATVELTELGAHLENYCPQRSVPCHYCGLMTKATQLDEHQEYCGTRTEECEKCRRCIMYKDLPQHIGTDCGYPPAPQPVRPGNALLSYLGLGGWGK
ncbi:ubiquitin fusion degradation protein, putative [Acanthamoeba castellanii str. Neff]|uniref:Ubiquitin fusion degradation protein, putative n=1 Tax=Acanthamoeba castellanii (strain ATCC 30010 / Neff) TaxID=1257118 RepID=L8H4X5_ACACF|nr:ubiquitin fusion degradation protein, putative [Acanthamoeba castellanii str. Neff]ELR19783.1 ubiquitin fusion degradation protein, putative [Acanthamoeba castellanii str. Neff]